MIFYLSNLNSVVTKQEICYTILYYRHLSSIKGCCHETGTQTPYHVIFWAIVCLRVTYLANNQIELYM